MARAHLQLTPRRGAVAPAVARRPGGSRFFSDRGELNASDNKDAIAQIVQVLAGLASGQIDNHEQEVADARAIVAARRDQLVAAFYDGEDPKASTKWKELGAAMTDELQYTMDREGFMRRLLMRVDVSQGADPRIPTYYKDVVAFRATAPVQSAQTINREGLVVPEEFYVRARVFVEQRDIEKSPGDILERKYLEAQEAIMVQEDRTWKYMADQMVGLRNNLLYMSGGFTPGFLSTLSHDVNRHGLLAGTLLISSDIVSDLQSATEFSAWFDPVTKMELILNGNLGRILGMEIITDGNRHPNLQVLKPGEVYAVAAPNMHGAYTDRGPVQSAAFDGLAQENGIPGRGWNMYEIISMTLHNPASVAKGKKV